MKRIIPFVLALCLLASVAACADRDEGVGSVDDDSGYSDYVPPEPTNKEIDIWVRVAH